MIDIFLYAPTRQALVADLAPLGLGVDGELAEASSRHALAVAAEDDAGLVVALRCLDEALAVAVTTAEFSAGTSIVSGSANWQWAGEGA